MHMRPDIEPARARIPPAIIGRLKDDHITRLDVIRPARDPVLGGRVRVPHRGVRQAGDGVVGVGGAVVGALGGGLGRDVLRQGGVADARLAVVVLFL
jgi:hypothetical protein